MPASGLNDSVQYLWAGGAGLLGRLMYHLHLLQRGERKSFIWIMCDLAIALGMGWIALGLCDWLNVSWQTSQSVGIMMGWAGPQLINRSIDAAIERFRTAKVTDDKVEK